MVYFAIPSHSNFLIPFTTSREVKPEKMFDKPLLASTTSKIVIKINQGYWNTLTLNGRFDKHT